jgi:hypothetical protein
MKKTFMHVNVREANNKILNIILYWDIIFFYVRVIVKLISSLCLALF